MKGAAKNALPPSKPRFSSHEPFSSYNNYKRAAAESCGKKRLVIFPVCRAVPTNVSREKFLCEHIVSRSP